MNDPVNHPSHYTSSAAKCKICDEPIECIDITEHMGFCLGNAIKYIWRAGSKHSESLSKNEKTVQDLEKSIWYINRHIAKLEEAVYHEKECGK
jgi:Protein of unknwon function (DUF3310)